MEELSNRLAVGIEYRDYLVVTLHSNLSLPLWISKPDSVPLLARNLVHCACQ